MANTDAPFGLRPAYHRAGGTVRYDEYPLATAHPSMFTGDPVLFTTAGQISLATTGTRLVGSFQGAVVVKSNGQVDYRTYIESGEYTAARSMTAKVTVDPNIVYHIQADDDTTPLATTGARVNSNADLLAHATGSTLTGNSKVELDASTATTAAAQLRIHRLVQTPDNAWGGNEVVEVTINEHQWLVTGITTATGP